MFGIGGSEILVILIVALLFLGPDKLPEAAKQISKGIRDLKKQSRVLQQTIENDEHIGGAIRDLKSALRGDELPVKPPVRKLPDNTIAKPEDVAKGDADAKPEGPPRDLVAEASAVDPPTAAGDDDALDPKVLDEPKHPAVTLPPLAGEIDPEVAHADDDKELAAMIKPPVGETTARAAKPEPEKHG